ncbi:hypothetical protein BCR36DRAFT_399969 [Piromyces finnis]|uniref:Uncharacterized protein n=1 Tax=Piromyces finnis TaxID=1754191 RepID=A0A1Y1UYB4_9FUNG|nr:hypothetical protein BCR36DRAFT_399969 [Piromyces finnis]|eukprot:ORX43375.1 hypothetical protein BCR36DRAFT_399969 [Piromyces finnis]
MKQDNLKYSIQLPPIVDVDSISKSFLKTNKGSLTSINHVKDCQKICNFDSIGILSSYGEKEISIIRTQPLNLYVIQKNILKYVLKFKSIPVIARIDYYNTSVGKSKLKHNDKDSLLELYVQTIQGELWQIYLNMEFNEIHFKNNVLKDEDGKTIKKKKISKNKENKKISTSRDIYPIIININTTIVDHSNILTIKSVNKIEYDNIYSFNLLYQSKNNNSLDNLCINEYNYYINRNLFKKLFETESNKVHLIGTNDGEVYWMDNIYTKSPKLLVNLEEPIMAFHIINLKSDDDKSLKNNKKNQQFSFNDMNIRTTPKNINSDALMILGVVLYKIISNESINFIIKKKYNITNPIYSSYVLNHYLFITSKYYDGSKKITFYDFLNEEREEDFKDILIPKIYPSSNNIQDFKCVVNSHNNIIFQQLHLNGLFESGDFNFSNLLLDKKNDNQRQFMNPSKIIIPILEDISRLSDSIEEYKKDHQILNKSISSMNETIFFLISFIDYINKNEYKELPISCDITMKYHPHLLYYSIFISLKFKIAITNNWISNYFIIYIIF